MKLALAAALGAAAIVCAVPAGAATLVPRPTYSTGEATISSPYFVVHYTRSGPDQPRTLARVEADHTNLLAALRAYESLDDGAERALTLAPDDLGALGGLARLRLKLGDGTGARALAERAVATQSDKAAARQLLQSAPRCGRGVHDRFAQREIGLFPGPDLVKLANVFGVDRRFHQRFLFTFRVRFPERET